MIYWKNKRNILKKQNCVRLYNAKLHDASKTDEAMVDISKKKLSVEITKKDVSGSHITGQPREGKHKVIVRFGSYRIKEVSYCSKRTFKMTLINYSYQNN